MITFFCQDQDVLASHCCAVRWTNISFNETNVILGYGYFDYCIGKDSKLVLKIPDFEFVTDIKMIDMRKNGKDFIISEKAFNLYKKKNE